MFNKEQSNIGAIAAVMLLWMLIAMPSWALAQLASEEPVIYSIQAPKIVNTGEEFTITTVFNIQEPWYIYALTGVNTIMGMIETKISFTLPEGITKAGKIQLPEPDSKGLFEVYTGKDVKMSQVLFVNADLKPGSYNIACKIRYQTCNEDICFPSRTEKTTIVVTIK